MKNTPIPSDGLTLVEFGLGIDPAKLPGLVDRLEAMYNEHGEDAIGLKGFPLITAHIGQYTLDNGIAVRQDSRKFLSDRAKSTLKYMTAKDANTLVRMTDEYAAYWYEHTQFPAIVTPSQMLTRDFIDPTQAMNELNEKLNAGEEIDDRDGQLNLYDYIPCWVDGVLYAPNSVTLYSTETLELYYYWRLLTLDLENDRFLISVQSYTYTRNQWWPGAYATAWVGLEPGPDGVINLTCKLFPDSCYSQLDVFKEFSGKALGWDAYKRNLWKNVILKYTRAMEECLHIFVDGSSPIEMLRRFLIGIGVVNYYLSHNKTTRLTKPNPNIEHVAAFDPEAASQRKARKVGALQVLSKSSPRAPTPRTVIHYRIECWQTRGHIRRYKSGKEVYVKPHESHRRKVTLPKHNHPAQALIIGGDNNGQGQEGQGGVM